MKTRSTYFTLCGENAFCAISCWMREARGEETSNRGVLSRQGKTDDVGLNAETVPDEADRYSFYGTAFQKWGNDDYPFLSTIQFQGIMNLLFGILVIGGMLKLVIGGMLKLIIGDKDKEAVNGLLLRLVEDHEKENPQQADDVPDGTDP